MRFRATCVNSKEINTLYYKRDCSTRDFLYLYLSAEEKKKLKRVGSQLRIDFGCGHLGTFVSMTAIRDNLLKNNLMVLQTIRTIDKGGRQESSWLFVAVHDCTWG